MSITQPESKPSPVEDHPDYYDVIRTFEKTECAVIVNTSFNVRSEPIVCTPYDAYRCFMRTGMDVLIWGTFCCSRRINRSG